MTILNNCQPNMPNQSPITPVQLTPVQLIPVPTNIIPEVVDKDKPKKIKKHKKEHITIKMINANMHKIKNIVVEENVSDKIIVEKKNNSIQKTYNASTIIKPVVNLLQTAKIVTEEKSPKAAVVCNMSWDNLFDEINNNSSNTQTLIEESISNSEDKEILDYNLTPDIINSFEKIIDVSKSHKGDECTVCGGVLYVSHNHLICKKCGLVIQGTSTLTDEDRSVAPSNTNDGFIPIRFVGKSSYGHNRNLYKSCANYSQYRKTNTLKEMQNWNSQSKNNKLPKIVIEEANNMFASIKERGHVYRKDVKKGVLSACLYYACYHNGITKTPNEIAQLVKIAEKFHSAGDRILRDLNERGVISLPEKVDPISDYVSRYFELLSIPKIYKQFVIDIIYLADKEKLHILCDSKNNTKCIGAIYLLIERVPELRNNIDKEKIDKECSISRTTFIKYYNMICKYYRKFAHIFCKHKIPMKSSWRENILKTIRKAKKNND